MRTKKVNRYWCDHCNKAGLSASAMARHEAHCTLNPARNCRVCGIMGGSVKVGAERMAELVALLPDSTAYNSGDGIHWSDEESEHAKLARAVAAALPKLREETDNCPACILAALRQRKIPVPMVDEFNFSAEMKTVFDNNPRNEDWPY